MTVFEINHQYLVLEVMASEHNPCILEPLRKQQNIIEWGALNRSFYKLYWLVLEFRRPRQSGARIYIKAIWIDCGKVKCDPPWSWSTCQGVARNMGWRQLSLIGDHWLFTCLAYRSQKSGAMAAVCQLCICRILGCFPNLSRCSNAARQKYVNLTTYTICVIGMVEMNIRTLYSKET